MKPIFFRSIRNKPRNIRHGTVNPVLIQKIIFPSRRENTEVVCTNACSVVAYSHIAGQFDHSFYHVVSALVAFRKRIFLSLRKNCSRDEVPMKSLS